ncbi:MAG: class I SAM-dependent methyltransferase [Methylobacterium sp.]|nr:MAG: class I SAM-dependent methyltransferase [Methylobacterium sp.]
MSEEASPPGFWEAAFVEKQMMWGEGPTRSALLARDLFVRHGASDVLVPGVGYGRNAKVFLDAGMAVTGIEISPTAIAMARARMGLTFPIHQGSVTDMPFDTRQYDGIFCHGLAYLLDAPGRERLIGGCFRQLAPGGHMVFTVIAKQAPMYGKGPKLGEDWYEPHPGVPMFFYDEDSARREFGACGVVEVSPIDEPAHAGSLPFLNVICRQG